MGTDATWSVAVGSTTFIYGALKDKGTRSALVSSQGFPEFEYSIWHIPGTTGNVVCNLGETSRLVVCVAVYIGPYPEILRIYERDKIAIAGVPIVVTDCSGSVHHRCRLKGARDTAPPRGIVVAASNVAFFTAEFAFERHGWTEVPVPSGP